MKCGRKGSPQRPNSARVPHVLPQALHRNERGPASQSRPFRGARWTHSWHKSSLGTDRQHPKDSARRCNRSLCGSDPCNSRRASPRHRYFRPRPSTTATRLRHHRRLAPRSLVGMAPRPFLFSIPTTSSRAVLRHARTFRFPFIHFANAVRSRTSPFQSTVAESAADESSAAARLSSNAIAWAARAHPTACSPSPRASYSSPRPLSLDCRAPSRFLCVLCVFV